MTNLKRPIVALFATLAVGAGSAIGTASSPAPQEQGSAPVTRVQHFYPQGPSADYRRFAKPYPHNGIGIGEVEPTPLKTPTGADSFAAVIELSIRYRTRGAGPFYVDVIVDTGAGGDDPSSDDLSKQPNRRFRLPAGPARGSAATRFIVPGLEPGTTYRVRPVAASRVPKRPGRNFIQVRGAILTVDTLPEQPAPPVDSARDGRVRSR